MVSFKRWVAKPIYSKDKKRTKNNEPRGNQTYREGGNNYQQGQTAGSHPQVPQQTVHLFPVPEL